MQSFVTFAFELVFCYEFLDVGVVFCLFFHLSTKRTAESCL